MLDTEIGSGSFERLCTAVMYRTGFQRIRPAGGTHDEGRDAEEILRTGHDELGRRTFFQYSLEKKWEVKLRKELQKVKRLRHDIQVFVFVTTSTVTERKLRSLQLEVKRRFGWILQIFSREFLRHNLEEVHTDLAQGYLGVRDTSSSRRIRREIRLPNPDAPEFKEISSLLGAGDYEAAILKTKAVMTVTNKIDVCWVIIANAHYSLTNYRDALRAAEKALAIDPSSYEARFIKACVLIEDGIASHARPMLVQGRSLFQDLTRTSNGRKDAGLAYNLANALSALGEHALAATYYRRCLKRDERNARAWKNLSSCYHHLGKHDDELRCLDRALAIDPDLPEALFSKGQVVGTLHGRPLAGLSLVARAMEVDPEFPQRFPTAYWWRASFLLDLKRFDEALKSLDEGLRIAVADQHLLDLKARALATAWRHDPRYLEAARTFFRFRLEVNPKEFASMAQLVQIARAMGAEADARGHAAQALAHLAVLSHTPTARTFSLTWEEWDRLTEDVAAYVRYRRSNPIKSDLFAADSSSLISDELWPRLGAAFHDVRQYILDGVRSKKTLSIRSVVEAMRVSRRGVKAAFVATAASVSAKYVDRSAEAKVAIIASLIAGLCEFALYEPVWNIGYLAASNGVSSATLTQAMDRLFLKEPPGEWAQALICYGAHLMMANAAA